MRCVGTVSRGIRLPVVTKGEDIIEKVQSLVLQNRKMAQTGLTLEELENLNATLKKIIKNCQST